MRIVRKEYEAGVAGLESVLGVFVIPLFLGGIALAGLFLPIDLIPRCRTQALFGFACPSCGGCRAVQLLLHGNIRAALAAQPFIIALGACGAAFSLYALGVVMRRWRAVRLVDLSRLDRYMLFGAVLLLAAADWVYALWRY
jgi:hypothetical protein